MFEHSKVCQQLSFMFSIMSLQTELTNEDIENVEYFYKKYQKIVEKKQREDVK